MGGGLCEKRQIYSLHHVVRESIQIVGCPAGGTLYQCGLGHPFDGRVFADCVWFTHCIFVSVGERYHHDD